MKHIELTQGKIAIVDDEDYEWLSKYKWCARREDGDHWYAIRKSAGKHLRMHREILKCPETLHVDHKNGDGLDNRRSNLRTCSNKQNGANRKKNRGQSSSKFKGVHRKRNKNGWYAQIFVDGKQKSLGVFETERDAALAYNEAAIFSYGEFARVNVISVQTA